ncbi:MAG: hypothetical protein FWH11_08015 [Micrococcales bacterium]|nr:hypothetical protein [Micrococcales bacterium]
MDFDATHNEPLDDAADVSAYEPYTVPPVAEFGAEQVVAYDWDGDGVNDSLVGYLEGIGSFDATDFDQDGDIDYLAIDTDGDGQYDVLITNNYETGGYDVQWDSDGDGSLDSTDTVSAEDLQTASPALWNLVNEHYTPLDLGAPDLPVWYPEVHDGQIAGDPFAEGDLWFSQSWDGSLVPASVVEIYNCYSETTVTSTEFVQIVNGYAVDGGAGWVVGPAGVPGLTPEVVVGVLETSGISVTTSYASMTVLEQAVSSEEYTVLVAYESAAGVSTMTTVTSVSYETSTVYLSHMVADQYVGVPVSVFEQSWAASEYTMVESTQTVAEYYQAQGVESYQAYTETSTTETASATVVQQATASGPWVLLPISGATLAQG